MWTIISAVTRWKKCHQCKTALLRALHKFNPFANRAVSLLRNSRMACKVLEKSQPQQMDEEGKRRHCSASNVEEDEIKSLATSYLSARRDTRWNLSREHLG